MNGDEAPGSAAAKGSMVPNKLQCNLKVATIDALSVIGRAVPLHRNKNSFLKNADSVAVERLLQAWLDETPRRKSLASPGAGIYS